ncbi:MAG: hypothetical protein IPP17_03375 [Bacteroidetes bacterium]|nr:hypothetical protein [Bacteroidota bacterium]
MSIEFRHIIDDILQKVEMSLTPDQDRAMEQFLGTIRMKLAGRFLSSKVLPAQEKRF